MKCPKCVADSAVLETRVYKTVFLQRKRECFNGHRFYSFEVTSGCLSSTHVKRAEASVAIKETQAKNFRYIRDHPNMSGAAIAARLGITQQSVFGYRHRMKQAGVPFAERPKPKPRPGKLKFGRRYTW